MRDLKEVWDKSYKASSGLALELSLLYISQMGALNQMNPRTPLPPMRDWKTQLLTSLNEFCDLAHEAKAVALKAKRKPPKWTQWSSWSSIGIAIANDPGLFFRINNGQSVTITTYERIREWFDKHWPKEPGD